MYTSGALVFVMSVARITVIRLRETPKYLLGMGEEELLVENFQAMAAKYNRHCSITVEMLQECGTIQSAHGKKRLSVSELTIHFRGLFATKTIGFSTCLIWLSWTLIVSSRAQTPKHYSNSMDYRVLHIPFSMSFSVLTWSHVAQISTSQHMILGEITPWSTSSASL